MRIAMNDGWSFTEEYEKGFGSATEIRIPHTCKEIPYNYANEQDYQMVCGYQKKIYIKSEWMTKRIFITFDGAAHVAVVYLNGKEIFTHSCGYTAFSIELTEFLKEGDNQITVKLDSRESSNVPPFGFVIDYMTYGGLYREVWLDIKEACFLADAFVTTEKNRVDAQITIDGPLSEHAMLTASIYDRYKTEVVKKTFLVSELQKLQEVLPKTPQYRSKKIEGYKLSVEVDTVEKWDISNPALYTVQFELNENGCDPLSVRFGFR